MKTKASNVVWLPRPAKRGRTLTSRLTAAIGPAMVLLLAALAALQIRQAAAYPPAPHHLFIGMVRDELGNPINIEGGKVIFETASGYTLSAPIRFDISPGVNYRLQVPMDAGITADLYQPTAMRPTMPFTIEVEAGGVTYLPIEMVGDTSRMGVAGGTTVLNLTLGVDSDGDGIPDAWEEAIIAASLVDGINTLQDVNPDDDFDGDGMSNLQEYLTGNYAFDREDGFSLKVVRFNGTAPVLEWVAIRGRTYMVQTSVDLKAWENISFKLLTATGSNPAAASYIADDIRQVEVEAVLTSQDNQVHFFRLMAR